MGSTNFVSKTFVPTICIPDFFLGSSPKNIEITEKPWKGYILSPDAPQMLTYDSNSIHIWCLNTCQSLQDIVFKEGTISQVSWPVSDRVLVSIAIKKGLGDMCDVFLLSVRQNTLQKELVCLSNASHLLAAGMRGDLIVTSKDMEWRACYSPLSYGSSTAHSELSFSNRAFCFSHKILPRTVKGDKRNLQTLKMLKDKIKSMTVHPHADHLAVGLSSGRIYIFWNILRAFQTNTSHLSLAVTQFHWHQAAPLGLVFSESGTFLFSGGAEGVLVKLDLTGVRGQTLTSQKIIKQGPVGSSSGNMARYYLPHLGSSIVNIRTFRSEWLSKERIDAAGLTNADPKGLLLCLHLENQVVVIVSNEMKIISRWSQWIQPPPTTGFLAPPLTTPLSIAANSLLLNGRTGHLQLFDWRKRQLIQQIGCCEDQDYVTPHRGEAYSSVEVYRTAMDKDGIYLATVERLHKLETRRDKKLSPEVQLLLGAFRPQRIRFFKWNHESKSFVRVYCDYNLDMTSNVLDMRFRPAFDQLFLLMESGTIVFYELLIETQPFRETWLQMGQYSLAELGFDIKREKMALQYASMDFSHVGATVVPHTARTLSISSMDLDTSVDLNMSSAVSSSTVPLIAMGFGDVAICLSIQPRSKITLQRDSICVLEPKEKNPDKKDKMKKSADVRRLFWHPRSMHIILLRTDGVVNILEWTQSSTTNLKTPSSGKKSILRKIVHAVLPGITAPVEDLNFTSSSLLLAFLTENGNQVYVQQWKSACNLVPLHQWTNPKPMGKVIVEPKVYIVKGKRFERPCKVKAGAPPSVTFISDSDAETGNGSTDCSVAVVYPHSFVVYSTRDENTSDWTAHADPLFSTSSTRPSVTSRGVKRLQALLESVEDHKRLKSSEHSEFSSSSSQGYWPTAKNLWDGLSHSSSTNSATHPGVWLKRLLDAELNLYIQSRNGQV